ncbi:MAG: class I SAM-dependent methyltransferase [Pikeienuella sp.]
MTPLETIIRRQIATDGPMSLHDYMAICLSHPQHGYYITRDPLGSGGDFTTAPEVSQMFGELVGLCLAQAWMDQGCPAPFRLVELGPGRGTLMADALRATKAVPGFHAAADLWLVETSPTLRREQDRRLPVRPNWADRLEQVPAGALFLIANEFFDALPIHQYVMRKGQWRERVVGLNNEDALTLGIGKAAPHWRPAPEAAVHERCPAGTAIAAEIGTRIARDGGAGVLVDYGYDHTTPEGADTFQALRNHAYVDPLATPGEADLTAHVDFPALAEAAPCQASQITPQGTWLAHLGIGARAQGLLRAHPDQAQKIADALHRLTDASQMGTLFKAMALFPKGAPPPPGFEER